MTIRMNVLIAASAIALAAGPTFADDHSKGEKKMDHGKTFAAMDADESGAVSMEEAKAYYEGKDKDTSKLEEKFAKMDSDENGEISKEEWDAAHAEKKEMKKEMKDEKKMKKDDKMEDDG